MPSTTLTLTSTGIISPRITASTSKSKSSSSQPPSTSTSTSSHISLLERAASTNDVDLLFTTFQSLCGWNREQVMTYETSYIDAYTKEQSTIPLSSDTLPLPSPLDSSLPASTYLSCADTALLLHIPVLAHLSFICYQQCVGVTTVDIIMQVRALMVRAQVMSEAAYRARLKGQSLVTHLTRALQLIMDGVTLLQHDHERDEKIKEKEHKMGIARPPHFLLHNSLIHYTRISRPLMRPGYMHHLLPSLQHLVDAMDGMDEDEMDVDVMVQVLMNLSLCYDATSQDDLCVRTTLKLNTLMRRYTSSTSSLRERVLRHSIHMLRHHTKHVDALGTELDVYKTKGREYFPGAKGIYHIQRIRSGIVKPVDVEKTISLAIMSVDYSFPIDMNRYGETSGVQPVTSTSTTTPTGKKSPRTPRSLAEIQARAHQQQVTSSQPGRRSPSPTSRSPSRTRGRISPQPIVDDATQQARDRERRREKTATDMAKLGVIAEIGRVAAMYPATRHIARESVDLTLPCKAMGLHRAWILSELTATQLTLMNESSHVIQHDHGIETLHARLEAIKMLDATLKSAERLKEPDIIQDGCMLVWNVCLPLLQPTYRSHVQRIFKTCASLLESIDSTLYTLRVQFHLELAKGEMDQDYVAKATTQVEKALQLDYTLPLDLLPQCLRPSSASDKKEKDIQPIITTPTSLASLQRPWDRYLYPLQLRLSLRTHLYDDAKNTLEEAIRCMETATSMKQEHMIRNAIERAIAVLEKKKEDKMDESEVQQRADLWFEIATLASRHHMYDLLTTASHHIMSDVTWDDIRDRNHIIQQAKCKLMQAKAAAKQLKALGFHAGDIRVTNTPSLHLASHTSINIHPNTLQPPTTRDVTRSPPSKPATPDRRKKLITTTSVNEQKEEEPTLITTQSLTSQQQQAVQYQDEMITSCLEMMSIGVRLNEEWIIKNAIMMIWNQHVKILHQQASAPGDATVNPISDSLRTALYLAHQTLQSTCHSTEISHGKEKKKDDIMIKPAIMDINDTDTISLMVKIGYALARCLEMDRCYEMALSIIHTILPITPALSRTPLISILARIHRRLRRDMPQLGGMDHVALMLEILRSSHDMNVDERKTLLKQTMTAMNERYDENKKRGKENKKKEEKEKSKRKKSADAVEEVETGPTLEEVATQRQEMLELEVEMWTQLSLEAHRLSDWDLSLSAARTALLPLSDLSLDPHDIMDDMAIAGTTSTTSTDVPLQIHVSVSQPAQSRPVSRGKVTVREESIDTISATRWRWYAICDYLSSCAILHLIDPQHHDPTTQDDIRQRAITRAQMSVYEAHRCVIKATKEKIPHFDMAATGQVALQAAKQYWNCVLSFTHSALQRFLIRESLSTIIFHLDAILIHMSSDPSHIATHALDPEFRCQLYQLQAECAKDVEAWNDGLQAINAAIKKLPSALRKSMWEIRSLFSSKLGGDAVSAIIPSDGTAVSHNIQQQHTQARMYVALAKTSSNRADQFMYYCKALDSISSPHDRIDYLIEYGEWLYGTYGAYDDARDALEEAIYLLTGEIVQDEKQQDEMISTSTSTSTSRNKTTRTNTTSRPTTHSRSPSSLGSSLNKTGVTQRTQRDVKSTSTSTSTTSTSTSSLTIAQLATLIRIHALLAHMSSTMSSRVIYTLVAQHYVEKMWETAMTHVQTHVANTQPTTATTTSTSITPIPEKKKGSKDVVPPPITTTTSSLQSLPTSSIGWIDFIPSQALCHALTHPSSRDDSMYITSTSLTSLPLFITHLQQLITTLNETSHDIHVFPIYNLLHLIATELQPCRSMITLIHIRMARICHHMGMSDAASIHWSHAQPILPTQQEMSVYMEQLHQQEQLHVMIQQQQEATAVRVASARARSASSAKSKNNVIPPMQSQETSQSQALIESAKTVASLQPPPSTSLPITSIPIRDIWMDLCFELLHCGCMEYIKSLLPWMERHIMAFRDTRLRTRMSLLMSHIASLEGQHTLARTTVASIYGTSTESSTWSQLITRVISCLEQNGDDTTHQPIYMQQCNVLTEAIQVFTGVCSSANLSPSSSLSSRRTLAHLHASYASLLFQHQHNTSLTYPSTSSHLQSILSITSTHSSLRPSSRTSLSRAARHHDMIEHQHIIIQASQHAREAVTMYLSIDDIVSAIHMSCQHAHHLIQESRLTPTLIPIPPPRMSKAQSPPVIPQTLRDALSLLLHAHRLTSQLPTTYIPSQCHPSTHHIITSIHRDLVQVYMYIHEIVTPWRIYMKKGEEQVVLVKEPSDAADDDEVAEMFFQHYDDVFGSTPQAHHISPAEMAVYHAGAQMSDDACSHLIMGLSLLTLFHHRYQHIEQMEAKRQHDQERIRDRAAWNGNGIETSQAPETTPVVAAVTESVAEPLVEQKETSRKSSAHRHKKSLTSPRKDSIPTTSTSTQQPPLSDYTHDTSIWSPELLRIYIHEMSHIQPIHVEEKKGKRGQIPKSPTAASKEEVKKSVRGRPDKSAPIITAPIIELDTPIPPPHPFSNDLVIYHLQQAINKSMNVDDVETVKHASLGLVHAYGTWKPNETAKYMSLHISASMHLYGIDMFCAAAAPTHPERLIYERRTWLRQHHVAWDAQEMVMVQRFLSQHADSYRRLTLHVDVPVDDPTTPPTHDVDDATQPIPDVNHYQQEYDMIVKTLKDSMMVLTLYYHPEDHCIYTTLVAPNKTTCVSRVALTAPMESQLASLLLRIRDLHAQLTRVILVHGASISSPALDECDQLYNQYITEMSSLLEPCFTRAHIDASTFADHDIILIVDAMLWDLPIEALDILPRAKTRTREFSFHMLYQRLLAQENKMMDKGSVGFVVDSHREDIDSTTGVAPTLRSFTDIEAQSSIPWQGITGEQHIPVTGEWQRLLVSSSTFIYHGMEAYLARVAQDAIAAVTCKDVSFVHLSDRATNETSYRRQSKLENQKSPIILELSSPYNTALLLSLRGVNVIALNRYASAPIVNACAFHIMWEAILGGQTIGTSIESWRSQINIDPMSIIGEAINNPRDAKRAKLRSRGKNDTRSGLPASVTASATTNNPTQVSRSPSRVGTATATARDRHAPGSSGNDTEKPSTPAKGKKSNEPPPPQLYVTRAYDRWNTIVCGLGHLTLG